jgi:hypothetical protein
MRRIFCLALFYILISPLRAQNANVPLLERLITIHANDETIESVLVNISEQAGFVFSYSPEAIHDHSRVTINAEDKPVKLVLNRIFSENINYKARGKYVILRKKASSKRNDEKTFEGYIYDIKSGRKLTDVSVYDKNLLVSAVTDQYGYFKMEIPADKPLPTLRISKSGYSDTLVASISENQRNKIMEIAMNAQDTSRKNKTSNFKRFFPDWLIPQKLTIHSINLHDSIFKKVQFSFLPMVSTNQLLTGNIENDLSFNMTAGYTYSVRKAEFGGMLNVVRTNAGIFQVAGIGNIVGENSVGFQGAGIFNRAQSSKGVQAAGIINITKEISNVQLAGIGNIVAKANVQSAGVFNKTMRANAQLAGILNMAKETNIFQGAGIANILSDTSNVQLAGILNQSHISKVQAAGIFNQASKAKVQISGVMNIGGKTDFIQAAGILNHDNKANIQLAGVMNLASNNKIIQSAGLINLSSDTSNIQLAGMVNNAKEGNIQVSGFINKAIHVKTLQLGIINIVDSCSGIQIGLFSFAKKGYHQLEFSYEETSLATIAFRSGMKYFHTTLSAGAATKPSIQGLWAVGYGLGTSFGNPYKLLFDIDLSTSNLFIKNDFNDEASLFKAYFGLDRRIMRRTSIATGLSYNLLMSKTTDKKYTDIYSNIPTHTLSNYTNKNDLNLKTWIGWKVALRFF